MARQRRIFIPGVSAHVIDRGTDRLAIFRDDSDHRVFLAFLQEASSTHSTAVHGYALMRTHYHLIATPSDATALPRTMHETNGRYVQYFNRRYDRIGTLWAGRYRAPLICDERYWISCLRYIEHNPLRAGIVARLEDYRWTSYPFHAMGAPSALLTDHPLIKGLGRTDVERRVAYRALIDPPMSDEELAAEQTRWCQVGDRTGTDTRQTPASGSSNPRAAAGSGTDFPAA
jgi:REP-associated tyrosine transposase